MMADANNKRTVSYKTGIRTTEGLRKRFLHKGDKHNKFTIFRDETTSVSPGFHAGHSSIPVTGIEIWKCWFLWREENRRTRKREPTTNSIHTTSGTGTESNLDPALSPLRSSQFPGCPPNTRVFSNWELIKLVIVITKAAPVFFYSG